MAHHRFVVHPLVLRRVHVVAVRDVTPRMRRVTLGGPELGAFTRDGLDLPAFASPAFDDHVKLVFAADGDVHAALPVQLEDGIDWPPSTTRQGRDYTPRRFDAAAGELDLDLVLHGDGPAAGWARDAVPGAELWFAGPKSSTVVPDDADWVLLVGDETALPAIGRFLEERPLDVPVRAVVTVADPTGRQDLATRPGDDVTWVVADPADEGALLAAVRAVEPLPGTAYVWAAAESRVLLPVRRYVAGDLGVPKSHANLTGYWHRTDEPAGATTGPAPLPVPPPSPAAWFAVHTALRLGLVEALADGPVGVAAVARRCEVDPARFAPLLDVLAAADVLAVEDGALALGPVGELLADDEHLREEYEGVHAAQLLALADLAPALAGGDPAWARRHGGTLRTAAQDDPEVYADLAEQAEMLPFLVTGVPRMRLWAPGQRVACGGPGALVLADLLREKTGAITTVVEDPGPLRALLAPGETPHAVAEHWGAQDVAVTALALGHRTDAEAVEHLRELRAAAPLAVLVEALRPDALGPGAAEDALLHLATLGVPPRSPEDVAALAEAAGWRMVDRRPLGWGTECLVLAAG